MATEQLIIQTSVTGVRTVRRGIDDIATSADRAERSFSRLNGILATLGVAFASRAVIGYINNFDNLQNRLRTVTESTAELNLVTDELFDIAQRSRAPLSETATLYSRIAAAGADLTASQQDIFDFTELTAQALATQGSTAQESQGALLQLAQAIGGTVIQAQEFNSLIDGARPLLEAVAAGSDRFMGSVNALRQAVREGTVTSQEFFDAALAGSDVIELRFARTVITATQALIVFSNQATRTFGELSREIGIISTFNTALFAITRNFDDIARAAIVLITAALVPLTAVAIPAVISGFIALNVIIAANPFIALATVLVGVATALSFFGDRVRVAGAESATLSTLVGTLTSDIGDGLSAAFDEAVESITTFGTQASGVLRIVGMRFSSTIDEITDEFSAITEAADLNFDNIEDSFSGFLIGTARSWDRFIGISVGAFNTVDDLFVRLFVNLANAALSGFSSILNTVESSINRIIQAINQIPGVDLDFINIDALEPIVSSDARSLGEILATNIAMGVADQRGRIEGAVSGLLTRANEEQARIDAQEMMDALARDMMMDMGDAVFNPFEGLGEAFATEAALIETTGASLGQSLQTILGPNGTLITGFADATANAIVFGESFEESIGGLANTIAQTLISSLVQIGVQTLINAAIADTSSTTTAGVQAGNNAAIAASAAPAAALTSLASFGANAIPAIAAIGATLAAASLFQQGGVFDRPTAFAFGGGNLGVMGEAGPEAVMPLQRDRRGRLGVMAQGVGGGAMQINQEINITVESTGNTQQDQQLAQQIGQITRQQTLQVIQEQQRPGGMLNRQDVF